MAATTESSAEGSTMRDAFVERLMRATAGDLDIYATYIGDRLGLYRAWPRVVRARPPTSRRVRGARALRPRVARAADGDRAPSGRRRGRAPSDGATPSRPARGDWQAESCAATWPPSRS